MVEVTVKTYASLRELLGSKTLKMEAKANSIRQLIDFIGKEYNPRFPGSIIDEEIGEVKKSYKILLNGRDIDHLEGLETKIANGDTITFFPPVGGG